MLTVVCLFGCKEVSVKYAPLRTLATIIACSLSFPSQAMPISANGVIRSATPDVARPEMTRWSYEPRAVSCNLRIPCPWYLGGGRHYARYRRHWPDGEMRSTAQRNSYRPCPASVEFPNGHQACLGLP
jgi:hypothetical protein